MKALVAILLMLMPHAMVAQTERPWEQAFARLMTAEDVESAAWEDGYEMLCELEQHPMNLNTMTREELEALPFLTDQQVEGFIAYRDCYGPLKSMNELRVIREMDYVQIELLPFFTYIEDVPDERTFPLLQNVMKYGRHDLMGYGRIPMYERKGDKNGYLGPPYRHWVRYQFNYNDYVKAGIVGSQDAGEPFFAGRNGAGYDFYSFYLQVKHLGRLENAVIGKYKVSTGVGLVLNNSFGMGKLAMLQQLGRSSNTIRPHSSRSQTAFFQGAAASVRLSDRWLVTGFLSYRPFDATLNKDATVRTILTDGYHRTPSEMAKKNNTHSTDAGVHADYKRGGWHAGVTALYTQLDRLLKPDMATLYRRYYAQGRRFVNVSTDYSYLHPHFALHGETAIDGDGHLATINSLSAKLADGLSMMLLQRFYSYRYTALYAQAVSEGGHVQNESAVYLGLNWQPSPKWHLQAYTDYAYFPWARYQVSQSSHAWDNLFSGSYDGKRWSVTTRYRLHLRQKDNVENTALVNQVEHRGRLAFSWRADHFSWTTQTDVVVTSQSQWGYMLSQAVDRQWRALKLYLHAGYFHTNSYDGRLYVYERGPLYSFAFPAYYGEGLRFALMAQGKVGPLTLCAKVGTTHYLDRQTIGTGLQQIDSSTMTDVDLQVRWRF